MPPVDSSDAAEAYGRSLLVGERVRLRPLRDGDLPTLTAWWEDPSMQPLQQLAVRPRPAGAAEQMFREWSANRDASGAGYCVETLADAVLVGHVSVWGIQVPERSAELAIQLGPEYLGRKYGTDAVRTMLRYCFLALGANRVHLKTFAFNARAIRAYERAGFVREGVRREVLWIDGGFADEVLMSVLRREWTKSG